MKKQQDLYFVAAVVAEPFATRVKVLQQHMCTKFNICHNLNSPPHITLIPPFRNPPGQHDYLKEIIGHPVSIAALTTGIHHFEDRVIYIKVSSAPRLISCRFKVIEKLSDVNFTDQHITQFTPHITIGSRLSPQVFEQAWQVFRDVPASEEIEIKLPVLLQHNGKRWSTL